MELRSIVRRTVFYLKRFPLYKSNMKFAPLLSFIFLFLFWAVQSISISAAFGKETLSFPDPEKPKEASKSADIPEDLTEQEKELGKRAMADLAQMKLKYLEEDETLLKKLTEMANEIGRASPRPKIGYDVKIIDSEEVNAFTFPGGHVFVTKGLLTKVESDHELAGVMSHEIAHNVRFHAIKKMNDYQDISTKLSMVLLASLVLGQGKSADAGVFAAQAAQAISMAVLNGYSVQYEEEADLEAVAYLKKTHYNPVGMLTFMEKLASGFNVEREKAAGIYRTHPVSSERVKKLEALLVKEGIAINRRAVTKAKFATVKEDSWEKNPEKVYSVQYETTVILRYPKTPEGFKEASAAANSINWVLDRSIPSYTIQKEKIKDQYKIFTGATLILALDEQDARFNQTPLDQLTSQVTERLRSILWSEQLRL